MLQGNMFCALCCEDFEVFQCLDNDYLTKLKIVQLFAHQQSQHYDLLDDNNRSILGI